MTRWQRFWYQEGGQYAAALVRIGLAAAVIATVHKLGVSDYVADRARRPVNLYDPDGILMLLGGEPPSPGLLDALRLVAYTSSIMMLVGLASRTATLVSCLSALTLACYQYSFSSGWSHQNNVVFIAQIAFLMARGGDVLSIDALLRKLRGVRIRPPALGYQWAVRLTTLGVSMMFFSAFVHKMAGAHLTLRWALSDNLRNHLLVQFDKLSIERTAMADWLLQEPWRYETAAMLNLVSQAAPILAFFLFRRPLLRAAAGVFFLAETIALGVVMDLWNLNWLPLLVVFVDWDRLFARMGWIPRWPRPSGGDLEPTSGSRPARAGRIFTIAYVSVLVVTSFVPWIDVKLKTYPFTRFPMFSTVRAKPPYDSPQTYEFYGNRIESVGHPLEPDQQRELDRKYSLRWLQRIPPGQLRRKMVSLEKTLRKRYQRQQFTHARAHLVLFQAVAPPEPARLELHRVGILADKPRGRPVRMMRGEVSGDRRSFTVRPRGFEDGYQIVGAAVIVDDLPGAREIGLDGEGPRFELPELGGESVLVLVDVRTASGEELRFAVGRQPEISW